MRLLSSTKPELPESTQPCNLPSIYRTFSPVVAIVVIVALPIEKSTAHGRQSAYPEHAAAEMALRSCMLEQETSITTEGAQVELVIHDHEDIDVVRLLLTSDERPEDREAGKLFCAPGDLIHTEQSQGE